MLAAYFGWQAWYNSQRIKAQANSERFEQLLAIAPAADKGLTEEELNGASQLVSDIMAQDEESQYLVLAKLYQAKLFVDAKQLDKAEGSLKWVVDNADDQAYEYLARYRLANVYLAQKNFDAAIGVVSETQSSSFDSLFAEVKGDAHAGKNNPQEARAAYEKAIELDDSQRRDVIQLKLSDLDKGEQS